MARISRLSRREKQLILALLPFLLLGALIPGRLSVTTTPSLKYRVFFLGSKPLEHRIESGDYLLFPHKEDRLIKMVGCLPGDRLDNIDGEFFCNGEPLGRALTTDSLGKALPRFQFNGVVPAGRLFMVGHHARSYDSRYMGFIDASDITHKAYPLWPLR